jgi:hypothetical protein
MMTCPTFTDAVDAALTCIGTPYERYGRVPGIAMDCVGLIVAVGLSLGVTLDLPDTYKAVVRPETAIARFERSGLVRCEDKWIPGAVVVLDLGLAHLAVATRGGLVEARNETLIKKVIALDVTPDFVADHLAATFLYPGVRYG